MLWNDRLVFLLQAKIPFLKKNSLFVWLFIIVIIFIIIFYDYFTSFYVKHFEFPLCYINKLALPIYPNESNWNLSLSQYPALYLNKKPYTFNMSFFSRRGPPPCGHHAAGCWTRWWVQGRSAPSSQALEPELGRSALPPALVTPPTHPAAPPQEA